MTKIIKKKIDNILSDKYLSYAISTIISRSLPDVRDGFKPVHRRIIYSMYQLNLVNKSQFKKCARIVGDVMGKFHPHGDQAIYDSLVRMAQDFSSRINIIEGQGNFGNIDGDNAAAMRYTEARLNTIANYFFEGIEENAVDLKENYDGQNLEPVVLPAKLPNILLNGSTGIAVGMATNIPPHNLYELNKVLIQLISKPDTNLSNLLKILSGPDLPTGGEILISKEDQKSIYKNGKGSFLLRSKWNIENLKNGLYQIVIFEIPYQVNKTRLIEQLANLINNKKIPLDDIVDESDEKIRIVLKPKNRKLNANKLIELCFKLSDLSIRFSCNFNVLIDGKSPEQLGLKDILNNFIKFRLTTIKRKSIFNIEKIKKRLEILEGYLIAFKFLDLIIKIIRNEDQPKNKIIKKFKLTTIQAEAILSMRLGSLKKLDEVETNNEIKKLNKDYLNLNKLIKNKKILNNFLIDEIKNTNNELTDAKYKRKTIINIGKVQDPEINFTEFEDVQKLTIIVTNDGLLKSYKEHIDIEKLNKNQNNISDIYQIMSNQKLLIFISSGRVYTINPNDLPSGKSSPKNFIYFIDANIKDKFIKLIPFEKNLSCLIASYKGKGFIANLEKIVTTQKKGKQLFNLKSNDYVIKVIQSYKDSLACVNNESKLLIYKTNILPTLQKSGGVLLQKIKNDGFLSDITSFDHNDGISWKNGKYITNEKKLDFWQGKRAQSGKKVPKRFNKNLKFI